MTNNKKVSFWQIFWPSLISGIVLIIIFFVFFSSIINSVLKPGPNYDVKNNTVLHLQLDGPIKELGDQDINIYNLGMINHIGLSGLLYGFEKAAKDNNIKGIFIELKGADCGYETATEIRNAIKKFEKESGKFVIAYHSGELVSLKEYYIASAATKNYGFHSTTFQFLGLGTELMFYKGLFDKLDLEMQIIRGPNNDFKSAVEPYFLTRMSDSSRLQTQVLLNNIWTSVKLEISQDRNIPLKGLENIADNGLVRRFQEAVKYNLIDSVKYRDEVLQLIANEVGVKNTEDLRLKSFEKYAEEKFIAQQNTANASNANIALIVAQGTITRNGDGVASDKITKLFEKARKDKNIKIIVFRVNSPGGSALASDEIWREVKLANKEKKVIVSMGDLAASGGYYITAPASKIFAQKTTITGSIGVFGVIPYTGRMLEQKLGLSFDRVSTNQHAVMTLNKKLTRAELAIVQDEVDTTYYQFLQRVAAGRGMTVNQVDKIARGRVWTGQDALRVGLIDTLGGLNDAIAYAIKTANIVDPVIRYYPKVEKGPWRKIMETFSKDEESIIQQKALIPKELINTYENIKEIEDFTGIQARLPYKILW